MAIFEYADCYKNNVACQELRKALKKLRIKRLSSPGLSIEKKIEMLQEEARLMSAINSYRAGISLPDGMETPEKYH